jgi:hypothetical protein
MANLTRNFVAGKMNKTFDERVVPPGEYIDALNVRMGSTENSEVGALENTKGNLPLTTLSYNGDALSDAARCIGAFEDGANETIYWMVHDPNFPLGATGKLDLIVSVNVLTSTLTYHIISIDDGGNVNTTLNFNPTYLINAINKVDDLLFFTDDYNPPRFINVKRSYAVPNAFYFDYAGNADLLKEALQVIKRPPLEAPTVVPYITPGEEQFMVDRFICFAYRWRYADNEYSATSQWSDIAFLPNPFEYSLDSALNDGMTNAFNAATITYDAGGPLVVGIDLLFKEANSSVIKVIEKLNKAELGLLDNYQYTYNFVNSKIFTILPQSEILRLYDNVPRFAKAQTVMGNRLMYGNYVEGYNLIDVNGNPTRFTYQTYLIKEDIGNSILPTYSTDGNYDFRGLANTIGNSITIIELADVDLVEGSILNVNLTIKHSEFGGDTPFPSDTTQNTDLSFSFYLAVSYASVYDMVTSPEFVDAVGTAANIQPIYPGNLPCTDGTTWTDIFNCAIPNNLNSLFKYASGITGYLNQPIAIYCAPGDTFFQIQLPAMLFIDAYPATTKQVVEYYEVVSSEAFFQTIANARSLHSNRGYEIGIVYMDDFNRATTALVSPSNTVAVPCANSQYKNSIQVTIPSTQVAPAWATRYKFVIKADEENYDTIFSNIYFQDPLTNSTYFLIEGENPRKVAEGDRLIVKADSNGPTVGCVYATVLEKKAQQEDFITLSNVTVPAGTYLKINANNFSAISDSNSLIAPGNKQKCLVDGIGAPYVLYPMNIPDPSTPGTYIDYNIPAGSRISMRIKQSRQGKSDGTGNCERRIYTLNKDFIASANYANMKDWWDGDNIASILNTGVQDVGDAINNCPVGNTYFASMGVAPIVFPTIPPIAECVNYYQFYRNPSTNALYLYVSGTFPCRGLGNEDRRKSCVDVKFTVARAETTIVFETEPTDTLPDVFFENNLSFGIDTFTGNHYGNVQDQDIAGGTPAIVDTGFFNCFTFGNGVESYKIRDSIIGRTFNLGERVTTVAAQDYKEADRFADITYSGVYNDESNVNKLNEFNLGLLNFKPLEDSFGPIQVLDARQTDVLTLQEDKISYVLAGKNLLSDSVGGGAISSIPEVLGTQIARTEKYGISYNPESYVQWGQDRFFTDAKRGAVIQLRGDETGQQQLRVASESGMRTWFRDLFNESFNTQKLGGFDPYSNEYVLSSNEQPIPSIEECLNCGIIRTFTVEDPKGEKLPTYCVDLGFAVGEVVITYNIINIAPDAEIRIAYDYNGSVDATGWVSTSGTISFNKDTNAVNSVDIVILTSGQVVFEVIVACPIPNYLTLIEVVLTNDFEAGQTIHAEYNYINSPYVSPVQSNLVTFVSGTVNPLVSRWNEVSGAQGTAGIPVDGSTMNIATNKMSGDTFVFDPAADSFKYLRTNAALGNTPGDIAILLSLASTATPLMGGGAYNYAQFNAGYSDDFLYLIWDFRNSTPVSLCYSADKIDDVCCACDPCGSPCSTWRIYAGTDLTFGYYDCDGNYYLTSNMLAGDEQTFCAQSWFTPTIIEGEGSLELLQECGCDFGGKAIEEPFVKPIKK